MGTFPSYDEVSQDVGMVQFDHDWLLNVVAWPKVGGPYPDGATIGWKCLTTDKIPVGASAIASFTKAGHVFSFNSGITTYDKTLTLTFVENTKAEIKRFIRKWREASGQTNTGKGNDKSDLQWHIELVHLDTQKNETWRIELKAIYASVQLGQFQSGASPAIQSPSVTIEYDIFKDDDNNDLIG